MKYKKWLQDEADVLLEMDWTYDEDTGSFVNAEGDLSVRKEVTRKPKVATYYLIKYSVLKSDTIMEETKKYDSMDTLIKYI